MEHEWFDSFMNDKVGFLKNRWTAAKHLSEPRITSAFGRLMWAAGLLVVTLALMEPASAAGLNLLARLLFFSLHFFPATIVAWLLSGWLFNLRASRRVSQWILLATAGAITGILLAPVSVILEFLFGVYDATEPHSKPLSFTPADLLKELKDELLDVPPITAIVWPVMNAFVVWRMGVNRGEVKGVAPGEGQSPARPVVPRLQSAAVATDLPTDAALAQREMNSSSIQGQTAAGPSGFLHRLPPRLGQDIVFIEAQEHYLRIVTSRGEHLLLQGLANAIAELEGNGADGIQIHRSNWVAWKHVKDVEVRDGAMSVVLSTGASLKIGRRRAKSVLAGWRKRFT
jgi:hypothetical protein